MSNPETLSEVLVPNDWAKRQRWFSHYKFPLLPYFKYRPEDKYNKPSFNFEWLNIRIWTGISPSIGLEVQIDDTGGHFRITLPYVYFLFQFLWFPEKWHQKLWWVK